MGYQNRGILREGISVCDAFANAENHRFPIWWGCGGVCLDAFTQDWGQVYLWIKPPFSQIFRVIEKLRSDHAKAILIVLFRPQRRYIRDLGVLAKKIWVIPLNTELFELDSSPSPLWNET